MEKDFWGEDNDWFSGTKNDNTWGTYVIKDYINKKVSLPTILEGLEQINEDDEVFLPSELDEIERLVNLAISRKERGVIGEANILQEEREKTINEIIEEE